MRPNISYYYDMLGFTKRSLYSPMRIMSKFKQALILLPLPDDIIKNFYPTYLGTGMQARAALNQVALYKAKVDGINNPDNASSCL